MAMADDAEALAWRPTDEAVEFACFDSGVLQQFIAGEFANVVRQMFDFREIFLVRCQGVLVAFHRKRDIETGARGSETQTANPGKKINDARVERIIFADQ